MMESYITEFWNGLTIESIIKFFILYFFVVWIALVIWVTRDISNRTKNYFYQILSILLIIGFTPLGIFLYLLIRPRKTIFEKYYEEVEGNLDILNEIVEERLEGNTTSLSCPNCHAIIEEDFHICPECHHTLKKTCSSCNKEIRDSWQVCPYCKTMQSETSQVQESLETEVEVKEEKKDSGKKSKKSQQTGAEKLEEVAENIKKEESSQNTPEKKDLKNIENLKNKKTD